VPLALLAWPLLLAVAAAVLLSVAAPVGRGLDLLPRRGRWLLVAAAAVTTLTAAAIPLLGDYYGPLPADSTDPGFYPAFAVSSQLSDAVSGLTFAAVLALTLATAMGIDRAARRQVLTLMGAGAVGIVAIHLSLPRPFGMSAGLIVSGPVQAVLVAL